MTIERPKSILLLPGLLALLNIAVLAAEFPEPYDSEPDQKTPRLSPKEAAEQFKVPEGFHITLFAGEPDQICAACLGAHINAGAAGGFLSIMHFFAHEPVLHGRARAGHHRWRQAVLLHHRDLLSRWKVYTFEPDPLKDLASVFKRVV